MTSLPDTKTLDGRPQRYIVDSRALPIGFPTHRHDELFWAGLGRSVATFGFLEEMLGKAIFALTATRTWTGDEIDSAYAKWLPTLEKALFDPLRGLIAAFETAALASPILQCDQIETLVEDLRKVSRIRNVLCHGSWRPPDERGASLPLFAEKQSKELFATAIDLPFLEQVQRHTAELACAVINTVTEQGWQFPGMKTGPGKVIWDIRSEKNT